MSSEGNNPSKDPADETTLAGLLRSSFQKLMQGTDVMLPAQVVAYDRESNVATVQPLIAVLTTDGSRVTRAQIARVPVVALGGGGFVINFPLKAGDKGWIEASDRDISLYMQSLNESQPNTYRLHSFEDSRFLPDVMNQFDVGDVTDDEMTIQSLDGSVRVTLSIDTIKLVAPHVIVEATDIVVTGETTFNDHVTMTAGAEIEGIEFGTHKHTGVTTGGGTSGGPTA